MMTAHKSTKRSSAFFVLGLAAAVGVAAVAVTTAAAATRNTATAPRAGFNADPYREVHVTSQEAINAVKQMLDVPQFPLVGARVAVQAADSGDLTSTGPLDGATYRYFQVTGRDVLAMVDVSDGHVSQLLLRRQVPTSPASATLSTDQALAAATAFLAAHSVATDGLTTAVSKKDRGEVKTYQVSWQRIVNGVVVPDSRLVELDAGTGVVFLMHSFKRPYSDPAAPVVARDRAIAAALKLVKNSSVTPSGSIQPLTAYGVESADLQMTFTATGTQQLVWFVVINVGRTTHVSVYVDAETGSASILDVA